MSSLKIHIATTEDIPLIQSMAQYVFRKTYADLISADQMEFMLDYHTFITFLKDNNVEKEFRHNFFKSNGGVTFCEKVWDEEDMPLQLVFRTLLDWENTEEGKAFWRKIDNHFQRRFC